MKKVEEKQWLGKAECALAREHEDYRSGYRGGVLVFAVSADDIANACRLIYDVCRERHFVVIGFDYLFEVGHMDREPSDYELALLVKLSLFPVQFQNVHLFKPDFIK